MRVTVLLVALAMASAARSPLISVSKVTDLATTSASIALDLAKFTSNKIEESLSGEPRRIYHEFTVHFHGYLRMLQEWWSTGTIGPHVMNGVGFIVAVVKTNYERVNILSARIIDPIVNDFEKRYPSSEGLIGSSVLDRLLLAIWLMYFVKFAFRTVFVLVGFPSRKFPGKM